GIRGFHVTGVQTCALPIFIPDERKTLREGCVRPWQTPSYKECQDDMERYAPRAGVRLDIPWKDLDEHERQWVIQGDPQWRGGNRSEERRVGKESRGRGSTQ